MTALAVDTSPGGADRVWAVEDGEVQRTADITATGWTATGVTGAHDVAVAGAGTDIQAYAATDAGAPAQRREQRHLDDAGDAGGRPARGRRRDGRGGVGRGAARRRLPLARRRPRLVGHGCAARLGRRGRLVRRRAAARTLWAGGAFGVQRSDDGGATWARREGGLPARPVAVDVLADPFAATTAYAALAGGGAWRTTDGGATWTAANAGLPSTDVRVLAADPQVQGRIFAGTAAGVARSANGGGVWTAGSGVPSVPVLALAVDPAGHDAARRHAGLGPLPLAATAG